MAPLAVLYENISGAGAAKAEAKSAQNIANYNAAVMEREAEAIRQKARFEQRRQVKAGERIKSSLLAALGASGADITVGAPLELQAEQAAELELENILIGYEGEVGAQRALSQAALDRLQGRLYRQKGRNLALARNIQLAKEGVTLLTGFA